MHCPKIFQENRQEILFQMIEKYPLGTLISYGKQGLNVSLLPFAVSHVGNQNVLQTHIFKNNQQVADLIDGGDFLVIFHGPNAYVSPSLYASKRVHEKVVPTWNYVAIEVKGEMSLISNGDWIREHMSHLTDLQEQAYENPWKVSDAPEDYVESQIKATLGIEITIKSIRGKFKLSQNRPQIDHQTIKQGFEKNQNQQCMSDLLHRFL